jgi:putative phosphoribosyl transferase
MVWPAFSAMTSSINRTGLGIAAPGGEIPADLTLPTAASGLVIFCHGSGSDRFSPRNQQVAEQLQRRGLATLLFNLERSSDPWHSRSLSSLPALQQRLLRVIDWTTAQPQLRELPLGLFGSSTGAALALAAAASRPEQISTVVCRGGRPDLVFQRLSDVRCPVLLIVGEHDVDVLELNAWAASQLQVRNELVVIPQAGHLFSEPGAMESVSDQAYNWFAEQFSASPSGSERNTS